MGIFIQVRGSHQVFLQPCLESLRRIREGVRGSDIFCIRWLLPWNWRIFVKLHRLKLLAVYVLAKKLNRFNKSVLKEHKVEIWRACCFLAFLLKCIFFTKGTAKTTFFAPLPTRIIKLSTLGIPSLSRLSQGVLP